MSNDEPVKINTGVSMSYTNSTYEVTIDGPPRSKWNAMTEDEREKYLERAAEETLSDQVDAWAYVEDE